MKLLSWKKGQATYDELELLAGPFLLAEKSMYSLKSGKVN